MTSSLRHRRRADRFAQLLDEASGGRRQHLRTPMDEELTELVALRHQLVGAEPGPDVDPEFRTGLRAMLIATAEREGIGQTATPEPVSAHRAGFARATRAPRAPRKVRDAARGPRARTAVVAGVAVGAVAFTGMSTASENAVPGDPLYGVKRSTERAQLALASSDVGRGQLYLGFARTRLVEARTIASDLDRVFDDMDRDTSQGVRLLTAAATNRQDRAALDAIDDFTTDQRAALELLSEDLAGADLTRLATSLELLDAVEERTAMLRQSLRDCGGPSATSIDSLGPVPRACVALPPPSALDLGQTGSGTGTDQVGPAPGSEAVPEAAERQEPGEPGATTGPAPDDAPGAPADPAADADQPAPAADEPEPDGEPDGDEDGGLLSGLNRLLGDLLGS